MKKLILITGFLGAGKTTFLNYFFQLFPEKRIAVIVNEYGKVGIDGVMLSQKGYQVEEISQGSISLKHCRKKLCFYIIPGIRLRES